MKVLPKWTGWPKKGSVVSLLFLLPRQPFGVMSELILLILQVMSTLLQKWSARYGFLTEESPSLMRKKESNPSRKRSGDRQINTKFPAFVLSIRWINSAPTSQKPFRILETDLVPNRCQW